MSLKLFGIMAPLALGGMWATGMIGGGAYSRDVDRTPAQVMAALGDLDVREQPGSPGTDPARSGGVRPVFRTERGENEISFVVMSGSQVATRMTAHLEPLDGGRRTRITASVARGDAPDEQVSPAFRSKGLTLGLFASALEGELNALTAPPRKSQAECQEIMQRLLLANAPTAPDRSFAQGLQTVGAVRAVAGEMQRQGCPTDGPPGGAFEAPRSLMGAPGPDPTRTGGAGFEPGRPMVDVGRNGSR